MQPLRQLYLSGDSWYIRVFLGMVWYGAAPCKLSGVALVEELVENIPNSLFRTAFPLLGSPRHHQRFTNMQRKSQSLMISYICNYKLVVLWDLFDGFARAWEVRRQIKVANFWGKLHCDFKCSFMVTFMSADDGRQVSGWTERVLLKSLRSHKCSKLAPWVSCLLLIGSDQLLLPLKPLCTEQF